MYMCVLLHDDILYAYLSTQHIIILYKIFSHMVTVPFDPKVVQFITSDKLSCPHLSTAMMYALI